MALVGDYFITAQQIKEGDGEFFCISSRRELDSDGEVAFLMKISLFDETNIYDRD